MVLLLFLSLGCADGIGGIKCVCVCVWIYVYVSSCFRSLESLESLVTSKIHSSKFFPSAQLNRIAVRKNTHFKTKHSLTYTHTDTDKDSAVAFQVCAWRKTPSQHCGLRELNGGCGVIVFTVLLVVEFSTGFLSAQDIKQRNKIYTNLINSNIKINAVVAGEFPFCSPNILLLHSSNLN